MKTTKTILIKRASLLALSGALLVALTAAAVEFRDTGMGIPQEEQDKVWARLYRGDKSRSQRGLGLGLSLVRAVVEAHQGRVTLESEAGHGSSFTVVLPPGTAWNRCFAGRWRLDVP